MSTHTAPHQTVGWLIEQLQQYPSDMRVVFHIDSFGNKYLLSDYTSDKDKYLHIDIGDE